MLKPRPPIERVSLDYPHHPSNVPCPLPRWTRRVHVSIASPSARPSPPYGRVDIHIVSFEACLGFTRVTARWIAQPPKAAFVFCRSTFSLVPPLRSTDSFAASAAPFASFPATMGRSDFSRPFIVGYGLRPSRRGPCNDPHGQPGDLPVPEQKDSAHAR